MTARRPRFATLLAPIAALVCAAPATLADEPKGSEAAQQWPPPAREDAEPSEPEQAPPLRSTRRPLPARPDRTTPDRFAVATQREQRRPRTRANRPPRSTWRKHSQFATHLGLDVHGSGHDEAGEETSTSTAGGALALDGRIFAGEAPVGAALRFSLGLGAGSEETKEASGRKVECDVESSRILLDLGVCGRLSFASERVTIYPQVALTYYAVRLERDAFEVKVGAPDPALAGFSSVERVSGGGFTLGLQLAVRPLRWFEFDGAVRLTSLSGLDATRDELGFGHTFHPDGWAVRLEATPRFVVFRDHVAIGPHLGLDVWSFSRDRDMFAGPSGTVIETWPAAASITLTLGFEVRIQV